MSKKKGECLCWCPFHCELIGWVHFERRREVIEVTKSSKEIPIRLRELRPIKGYIPSDVVKACEDFFHGLIYVYDLNDIIKRNKTWLEELHKIEVPDSRWNGERIVFE